MILRIGFITILVVVIAVVVMLIFKGLVRSVLEILVIAMLEVVFSTATLRT